MAEKKSGRRVAICYSFFPHYREGVIRELVAHGRHQYLLVGDVRDPDCGRIRAWVPSDIPYVRARCWQVIGPVMYQSGMVRLALRRDVECLILVGLMYWPMTWVCAWLGRKTGKRVLFWTHGWTRPEKGLKAWLRRRFYRLADGLLLYGHLGKVLGIQQGFEPGFLHVIYNSLDYRRQVKIRQSINREVIQRTRREIFGRVDRPMVVCTSRLTPQRRLDLLLEAMAKLKRRGRAVDLLLVGDGPEEEKLQRQADELGVDVRFYGACYEEEILGRLIGAANVSVSPGKIGLTAIHSLTYGTPVITHDRVFDQGPEFEAIVPGKTGDLYRYGDVDDLTAKIEKWTEKVWPEEKQRQMCFEIVDRFWNPIMQRYAIERAIDGAAADDLFWMREEATEPMREEESET